MNLLHPDRGALYANMLGTMGSMSSMGAMGSMGSVTSPGTNLPQRSPFAIQELLGLGSSDGQRSPPSLGSSLNPSVLTSSPLTPSLSSSAYTAARSLASQASQLLEPLMVGASGHSMGSMRSYLGHFNPFSPTPPHMLGLDPSGLRSDPSSQHSQQSGETS